MISQFNSMLNLTHVAVGKRTLRYLKGTMEMELVFDGSQGSNLVRYCDADFANEENRKSISGCFDGWREYCLGIQKAKHSCNIYIGSGVAGDAVGVLKTSIGVVGDVGIAGGVAGGAEDAVRGVDRSTKSRSESESES
jgi:hypothetical protein